ncbi:hypothetical protein OUZ56_021825 [Daphnia magna]|uniref:Uncharacterized protein n=1 Tax=Daphnia magna TaxID=35525 RepID=A0ABR0AUJ9_9CRUS|nr:hypothetical protein OUZ56_021825 [Daphnia magna]
MKVLKASASEISQEDFNEGVIYETPGLEPQGGFRYVFQWTDSKQKKNWRTDSYRWRQGGSVSYELPDVAYVYPTESKVLVKYSILHKKER